MRTDPSDPVAAGALATNLLATLQHAATDGPVLRDAVVAALSQAFGPMDLKELVAELAKHQRAICAAEQRAQLAGALAERGEARLDLARHAAELAVRLDFTNPESHRVLGEILEEAGAAAAAHTEYLLAMHLGWEGAAADGAMARTTVAPTEPDDGASPAERRYRDAVGRATSCIESRDLGQAQRHARTAVTLDPSRPEGFNLLGVLAELTGRPGEARTQYRLAAELAPCYRPAAENLARLVRPWSELRRLRW